ncbi:ceramide glucosyltransferase [Purpureocillium lavendulum]|uniref:Ceramide glucosyltransferase n=1 Tax=Purpureocillium lavendulum TaxID=1247861 RepID=A0AB34FIJ4_9HYPO|nr:ceramide glucosyltransferase [Purpureocillium lavendulum]
MSGIVEIVASICLVWVGVVVVVQTVGLTACFRKVSRRPAPSVSSQLGPDAPSVTIIRPVKGLEPNLYDCIACAFQQDYPRDKTSIRLCVDDESDPAYPVLQKIIRDFPAFDAQILVETNDPALHGPNAHLKLGPNPKVRNMSRAYREAKGDVIWVMDCNVWAASGVLGRMVDKLMGFGPGKARTAPYKFVHQMPLVVDTVDYTDPTSASRQALLSSASGTAAGTEVMPDAADDLLTRICRNGGGRLDEMFMATTHVKFYGAINAVGIAPCIVGKSNMFRKSHLDQVTTESLNPILKKGENKLAGVDHFSYNICEDHLIGDLLWRSDIPGHRNHGIVWGDLALQPQAGMSIAAYVARRVRWLRARKFTVLAATIVEPGVESLLCCAYLAFAVTTLPWIHERTGIPQTWSAMALTWIAAVLTWMCVDWITFRHIHSGQTISVNEDTPRWAQGTCHLAGMPRRSFGEWILAWVGREFLALPIWTWAVLLGTTVNWRGKTFHVRLDTSVVDLTNKQPTRGSQTPELERGRRSSKDRLD